MKEKNVSFFSFPPQPPKLLSLTFNSFLTPYCFAFSAAVETHLFTHKRNVSTFRPFLQTLCFAAACAFFTWECSKREWTTALKNSDLQKARIYSELYILHSTTTTYRSWSRHQSESLWLSNAVLPYHVLHY